MTSRRCEYPYKIPGTKIILPVGMRVVIPIYGIHHDSEYYPEPEKFNPDRFIDQNIKIRYPYTFLPFGEGPRNCIGISAALTYMLLINSIQFIYLYILNIYFIFFYKCIIYLLMISIALLISMYCCHSI